MKKEYFIAMLFVTITTLIITVLDQAQAEDSLYVSEDSIVGIGTTDLDGTPATGQLTIKGTSNDGSTNILVGRDSAETNIFSINTDGNITGSIFSGKTITLSESVTNDTSESQLYTYMAPTTTSSSTSSHTGSAHYLRPIINSGVTQSGYEMGQRIQSFRNANGSSANDNGTLTYLYGQQLQYGHYNTNSSASPVTTTIFGLYLYPYYGTGTVTNWYDLYIGSGPSDETIENCYAIYQASTATNNYFGSNVGIGTSSPGEKLHIHNSSTSDYSKAYTLYTNSVTGSTTSDGLKVGVSSYGGNSAFITNQDSDGYLFLGAGNLYYQMVLKPGGYVGIGRWPSYQLHLSSDSAAKPNGGTWTSSSDIRLKTDVKNLTNAADMIMQYPKPILFKWKNPQEHGNITRNVVGLSAQELEKANPDMVIESEDTNQDPETINKDAELTDGKTKAIYFSNEFFALQLGAVQELVERVEALEVENQLIKTELCKENGSYSFCKGF